MYEQFVNLRTLILGAMYGAFCVVAMIQLIRHAHKFLAMPRKWQRNYIWTGGFTAIGLLWVVLWTTILTSVNHPTYFGIRFLLVGFASSVIAFAFSLGLGDTTPDQISRRKKMFRLLATDAYLLLVFLAFYYIAMAVLFPENRNMNIFWAVMFSMSLIVPAAALLRWQNLQMEQFVVVILYGFIIAITIAAIDPSKSAAAVIAALLAVVCWGGSEGLAALMGIVMKNKKEVKW